jgi:hypothetical protein
LVIPRPSASSASSSKGETTSVVKPAALEHLPEAVAVEEI